MAVAGTGGVLSQKERKKKHVEHGVCTDSNLSTPARSPTQSHARLPRTADQSANQPQEQGNKKVVPRSEGGVEPLSLTAPTGLKPAPSPARVITALFRQNDRYRTEAPPANLTSRITMCFHSSVFIMPAGDQRRALLLGWSFSAVRSRWGRTYNEVHPTLVALQGEHWTIVTLCFALAVSSLWVCCVAAGFTEFVLLYPLRKALGTLPVPLANFWKGFFSKPTF